MRTTVVRLGQLDCRLVEALPPGERPELAVVLCHGFGAPGDNLVSLAAEMVRLQPALARVRFVFPEAPLSLDSMGWSGSRAWWMIDLARIAGAGGPEAYRELSLEVPAGLDGARRILTTTFDAVSVASGLPYSRIAIGGFSQGAMMAADLALRLPEPPAALLLFSGTLVCRPEWERRAARRTALPVFQSHGRRDPVLPYANAAALHEVLSGAGLTVDFLPFDGMHSIPPEAVRRAAALLARVLGA